MSDSRRLESPAPPASADRESRTDALLVDGLDQYFGGHYEEAIHLWTRVLFLDRNHARARAYIARARTALNERQRRADEMVHGAEELLNRGELDHARALLAQAEQISGADEKVAELWTRLDRMERARSGRQTSPSSAIVDAVPLRSWRWSMRMAARLAATAACGALLVTAAASPAVRGWLIGRVESPAVAPVSRPRVLPVLSAGEVALVRARTLYGQGRLSEALQALDRVETDSAVREAADALRVEIQRWLLEPRRHSEAIASREGRP
jgi:tetratricopeptide (TPR) repeat protein